MRLRLPDGAHTCEHAYPPVLAGVPCAHTRTVGFECTKANYEQMQAYSAQHGKRKTNYTKYAIGGAAGLAVLAGVGIGAAFVFGDLGATLANTGAAPARRGAGRGGAGPLVHCPGWGPPSHTGTSAHEYVCTLTRNLAATNIACSSSRFLAARSLTSLAHRVQSQSTVPVLHSGTLIHGLAGTWSQALATPLAALAMGSGT
jgi:hypothetical protein